MKPSIEETLVDWFEQKGVEIKSIEVKTEINSDTGQKFLYKVDGDFYQVVFDKEYDGADLSLAYHQELVMIDERFFDTKLTFPTDKTFKIR